MRADPHVVHKKADKGAMLRIINTTAYIAEVLRPRHLGDRNAYERIALSPEDALTALVQDVLLCLDDITRAYDVDEDFKVRCYCRAPSVRRLLPLTYNLKPESDEYFFECPGRPICAMPSHPCEGLFHNLRTDFLETLSVS